MEQSGVLRLQMIVTTLGEFAVRDRQGRVISLPTRKDRALLAYLTLHHGSTLSRERLAALLWGDRADQQARDSLRQSLSAIRRAFRALGCDPLAGDREEITWSNGAFELDLHAFETERASPDMRRVLELYRGDLLPDFDGLSESYDNWLLPERERLRRRVVGLLEKFADGPDCQSCADEMRASAERLLLADKTDEGLYRALIKLELKTGNRTQALRYYRLCRERLAAELGVEPDESTEALCRSALLNAKFPVGGAGTEKSAVASVDTNESMTRRPSAKRAFIAVTPLINLSDDPRLNFLCDGIAEEISTGLGRFPLLAVIDRHSSYAIAKETDDVIEIGRRLGVNYLVQGSIQRNADGMRITVRLVDATTRRQSWANSYQSSIADVLSVPEQIIRAIVVALHSWIEHSIIDTTRRKPSLEAYEHVLRGIKHLRSYGPDDNQIAKDFFEQAVHLDPDFALALAYRAFADVVIHNYGEAPDDVLDKSLAMARKAIELDETEGRCHWVIAQIYAAKGDTKAEERHLRQAIELNPNDANSFAALGTCLAVQGRAIEALLLIEEAFRLNPLHPEWYWLDYSTALYAARRYEEAAEALLRRSTDPMHFVLTRLAACYAQMGKEAEAQKYAAKAMTLRPQMDITRRLRGWAPAEAEHLLEGFRKAGLVVPMKSPDEGGDI